MPGAAAWRPGARLRHLALLAVCLGGAACTPWPCVDQTIARSTSPDAAFTWMIVERNCGATSEVNVRFNLRDADGTRELFRLSGPFSARFVWKSPRLVHIVVMFKVFDDPDAWPAIESLLPANRDLRHGDLRIVVGTSRQFGIPPGGSPSPEAAGAAGGPGSPRGLLRGAGVPRG